MNFTRESIEPVVLEQEKTYALETYPRFCMICGARWKQDGVRIATKYTGYTWGIGSWRRR